MFFHRMAGLAAITCLPQVLRAATDGEPDSKLDIPSNTWVARPLPGWGKAPAGKDFRIAFNPLDRQLYMGFGDWAGPGAMDSGRQELFSYHVGRDEWTMVQPYCLGEGHIQPSGPDELGWVFDSRRNIFWMIPGFQWSKDCASSVKGKVMTFDPRTREWSIVEGIERIRSDVVYSHYDPKEDTILSFAWDGGRGTAIDIIDCARASKKRSFFAKSVSNARLSKNYSAMDPATRSVYGIDTLHGQFYRYDMDGRTLTHLGPTPVNPRRENSAVVAWDTNHGVLLWPYRGTLYVYDPSGGGWSARHPSQPENIPVFGQSAGFDPYHDAMVYLGGYLKKNPYIFLYRFSRT